MAISERQLIIRGAFILAAATALGWADQSRYTAAAERAMIQTAQKQYASDPVLQKPIEAVPYTVHGLAAFPSPASLVKLEATPNGDGTFKLQGTTHEGPGETFTGQYKIARYRPKTQPSGTN